MDIHVESLINFLAMGKREDIKDREEALYDRLFRTYFPALCYFARKLLHRRADHEDIVMNCFAKLWEKRLLTQDLDTTGSFLYKVVRNACYDELRKRRLNTTSIARFEENLVDPNDNFIDVLTESEVLRQISAEATHLPQQIKKVFQLYFVEGKTEWEISEELKTSYYTIRNQRQRAVALLKEKLHIQKNNPI